MRYNIFNPIHKALRAILYDNALQAQQTNFLDTEEVDAAVAKIEYTLSLFTLHAAHESEFIHPLISKFNPEVIHKFGKEHIECEFLAGKVKLAINAYDHSVIASDKIEKGKKIVSEFEQLTAFNLLLFIKEEEILNEILWDYYQDDEIMAIEQNIIATVPADILEFESRWMVKSLNNLEIGGWLGGVKQSGPDFIFQSLLALTEKELPAIRFEKLLTSLEPSDVRIS